MPATVQEADSFWSVDGIVICGSSTNHFSPKDTKCHWHTHNIASMWLLRSLLIYYFQITLLASHLKVIFVALSRRSFTYCIHMLFQEVGPVAYFQQASSWYSQAQQQYLQAHVDITGLFWDNTCVQISSLRQIQIALVALYLMAGF